MALSVLPPRASAEGGAELRVGVGADVVHRQFMAVGAVKVGPATGVVFGGDIGAGLTRDFGSRVGWNAGLGGIVVSRTTEQLGTQLNFLLRGSYCGEAWCMSAIHISHGEGLGIATDVPNAGLNLLLLEYRAR